MKIPIAKPQSNLPKLKNFKKNINKELQSGNYVGGQNVDIFESSLKKFLKIKYVTTLNSGTDALHFSLKALGIGKKDEVILPSFTYFATLSAVLKTGASPVFADTEKESFCISAATVKKVLTKKTKCIIPVNLYGFDSDVENLISLGNDNNIYVVEDNAQGFGSKTKTNKYLGTLGAVNAFSNYPSKTLGGLGDGGFITTNNKEIYEYIKIIKNQGQSKKYVHDYIGFNSRMDSLNAYYLNEKLKIFNEIKKSRKQFEIFYINLFSKYKSILVPNVENKELVLNYFTIQLPATKRNLVKKSLQNKGIETETYYRTPMHLQSLVTNSKNNLTNTESLAKKVLSMPFFDFPTQKELDYIESNIKKCFIELGIK